jgi:putative acetyltransferase
MQICQASTLDEIAVVRTLFQEYAAWLRIDLCFQGFAAELASLPGLYALPRGRLLLASVGGEALGCVALRSVGGTVCEMKRLFVRPAFQSRVNICRRVSSKVFEKNCVSKKRRDTKSSLCKCGRVAFGSSINCISV